VRVSHASTKINPLNVKVKEKYISDKELGVINYDNIIGYCTQRNGT
jgi:hypothetical protein